MTTIPTSPNPKRKSYFGTNDSPMCQSRGFSLSWETRNFSLAQTMLAVRCIKGHYKNQKPCPHMQHLGIEMCSMPLCKGICMDTVKFASTPITKEYEIESWKIDAWKLHFSRPLFFPHSRTIATQFWMREPRLYMQKSVCWPCQW